MVTRRHILKSVAFGVPLLLARPITLPALSLNYSFHGAPAPATAGGYNKLLFADDFIHSQLLDFSDTGASGFNWYRRLDWPGNSYIGGVPQDASNFSYANSTLTISTTQGAGGLTMLSACYKASAPFYEGHVIDPANGFYFEIRMAFNPALADNTDDPFGWPAVWMVPITTLTDNTDPFTELDFFECFPTSVGTSQNLFAAHQWNAPGSQNSVARSTTFGGADLTQFHTYGTRLTTMAANGGTGLIERFFDNSAVANSSISYSAGGGSSPASSPSNPAGIYSDIESRPFPILIGTGKDWPLAIDWVAVWGP